MSTTNFDDLLDTKISKATPSGTSRYGVTGNPIDAADIEGRLADYQFRQVTDDDPAAVIRAGERACIHIGTIFSRLGQTLNLDETIHREIACLWTIYELHLALGHEEAGREWRIKAKDLIIASLGSYPESGSAQDGIAAVGALRVPRPRRYAPYDHKSIG